MIKILKTINQSKKWAIMGIIDSFKEEFMLRVQFSFGLIQFILSIVFKFNFEQILLTFWIWLTLICAELLNTGIENNTDLITNGEQKHHAKRAKDSAGGAVFILSVGSWIIFFSHLISNLINT